MKTLNEVRIEIERILGIITNDWYYGSVEAEDDFNRLFDSLESLGIDYVCEDFGSMTDNEMMVHIYDVVKREIDKY